VKIVFMGTPEFAVPTLQRLCRQGLRPIAVYSQPARPGGRGLRVTPPAVAREAEALGLPLRQPEVLQRREEMDALAEMAPDLILTAAYGKIFRRRLLALPRLGCFNLHPSLLPRYRGLSPVPLAILRGDAMTGVTLYRMGEAVDAGPIVAQQPVPIVPQDSGGELTRRLAEIGAELVARAFPELAAGRLAERPQDESRACFAPRLERELGRLDWRLPATQIDRLVRALDPWPSTFTFCRGRRVKVLSVEPLDEITRSEPPGTVLRSRGDEPPVIAALPGAVRLLRVQPDSCRPQDGAAFCCGQRLEVGERLTPTPPGEAAAHA
jgi:methionyl-tRNA formyltransferase